jgi:quinol monooxygenase YgiN
MVRVIIERRLKPGKEREMWAMLHEFRSHSLRQPGNISGETLIGHDDPSLWVVISNWISAEHWRAWANSPERGELTARLEPFLTAPVKVTILEFIEEPKNITAP